MRSSRLILVLMSAIVGLALGAAVLRSDPISTQPATAPANAPPPTTLPYQRIPISKLAGKWKGPRDITVVASGGHVTIRGKHSDWHGTYDEKTGKIVAFRTPTAAEMSPSLPAWAAQKAEGQLRWRLELQVSRVAGTYGTLCMTGKWFQGTVQHQAPDTPDVKDEDRKATAIEGEPSKAVTYLKVRSI